MRYLPITGLTAKHTTPQEIGHRVGPLTAFQVGFYLELKLDTGDGHGIGQTQPIYHEVFTSHQEAAIAWADTITRLVTQSILTMPPQNVVAGLDALIEQAMVDSWSST